jgi:hypothetical protein
MTQGVVSNSLGSIIVYFAQNGRKKHICEVIQKCMEIHTIHCYLETMVHDVLSFGKKPFPKTIIMVA